MIARVWVGRPAADFACSRVEDEAVGECWGYGPRIHDTRGSFGSIALKSDASIPNDWRIGNESGTASTDLRHATVQNLVVNAGVSRRHSHVQNSRFRHLGVPDQEDVTPFRQLNCSGVVRQFITHFQLDERLLQRIDVHDSVVVSSEREGIHAGNNDIEESVVLRHVVDLETGIKSRPRVHALLKRVVERQLHFVLTECGRGGVEELLRWHSTFHTHKPVTRRKPILRHIPA